MSIPMSTGMGAEWDVNADIFHDLSWEALFDIGEMTQDSDMQFFAR